MRNIASAVLTATSVIAKPLQFIPYTAVPARFIGGIADAGRTTLATISTVETVIDVVQHFEDKDSKANEKPASAKDISGGCVTPPQNPKNDPKDPKDKDEPKPEPPKPEVPKAEKKIVHFGQNPNQSRHTFRHTEEHGLRNKQVKSAVEEDLGKNMQKIDLNKSYKGTVKVNGVELEYNAQEVASGEINIGKITIKKK